MFLDEIQAIPDAIAALRYFYECAPELPVVSAGSLLEFTLAKHSFSTQVANELINKGAVAEQFVGQQLLLRKGFFERPELAYWLREGSRNNAEVDYMIEKAGRVVPVEVKAGKSGSLRSLHQLMFEKKLPLAVRFDAGQPSSQQVEVKVSSGGTANYRLISLPLYAAGELDRILLTC